MRMLMSFVVAAVAWADVLVIDADDRRNLIYEAIGPTGRREVTVGVCENVTDFPTRKQCVETKKIGRTEFLVNLNALYGIPAGLSDNDAIQRISLTIESLSSELDEFDSLDKEAANAIRRRLIKLNTAQRILIRLLISIVSNLSEGHNTVIDPNSGIDPARSHDDQLMLAAFDPAWIDSTNRVWRLASLGAEFKDQSKLCRTPFRSIIPKDLGFEPAWKTLQGSKVGQLILKNGGVIWTDSKEMITVIPVRVFGHLLKNEGSPYKEGAAVVLDLAKLEIHRPHDRLEALVVETPAWDSAARRLAYRNVELATKLPVLCILNSERKLEE